MITLRYPGVSLSFKKILFRGNLLSDYCYLLAIFEEMCPFGKTLSGTGCSLIMSWLCLVNSTVQDMKFEVFCCSGPWVSFLLKTQAGGNTSVFAVWWKTGIPQTRNSCDRKHELQSSLRYVVQILSHDVK